MTETTQQQTPQADERKQPSAIDYARRHPALAVIGAAAIGLLGGVELAAGVFIGAGVAVLARGRDRHILETKAKEEAARAKEHGRQLMSHVPEVKQRARAVMQAVRGQLHATDHHSTS